MMCDLDCPTMARENPTCKNATCENCMSFEDSQSLIEVNNARKAFYETLASLYFVELSREQIEHLAGIEFASLAPFEGEIAQGYADMRDFLATQDIDLRQILAVDYAHTFLAAGNYETFAATPYESVFTSESGLLMQEARDEVFKVYCTQHLQPEDSLQTPEDHISFEFEFMAALLERMNTALLNENQKEACELAQTMQTFHRSHQLNWIDDLCDAVMDCAQTLFYKGVSKITRGFIHSETEVIDDLADIFCCNHVEASAE